MYTHIFKTVGRVDFSLPILIYRQPFPNPSLAKGREHILPLSREGQRMGYRFDKKRQRVNVYLCLCYFIFI